MWIEPGRFLVTEAGVLLTGVTTVKHNLERKFVGVDAGFNTSFVQRYMEAIIISWLRAP